jgi:hypothetical protein
VLSRRQASSVNDWAYRLVFEDAELQPLGATVIGVREDGHPQAPTNRAINRHIESLTTRLDLALSPSTQRLLASFLAALHRVRSLATERERAIVDGLRQQRAHLATSLVQPGLFDRRAERAAAARNATLDEALERCDRRLAELARSERVTIERRLVFGLLAR